MPLGKDANALTFGLLVLDSLGSGVCQVTSLSLDVLMDSFHCCYIRDTQHNGTPSCMNKRHSFLPSL